MEMVKFMLLERSFDNFVNDNAYVKNTIKKVGEKGGKKGKKGETFPPFLFCKSFGQGEK